MISDPASQATATFGNPFSTNRWLPGVFSYKFKSDGDDAPEWQCLLKRLTANTDGQRVFQIVGPHGSGKSTLLESLARLVLSQGFTVRRALLNQRCRKLPHDFSPDPQSGQTIFLLDGYERLSLRNRLRLRFLPWRQAAALLFTTHRPAWGVPVLHRTETRLDIFLALTETMQSGLDADHLRTIFENAGGNFRDAFFELYDDMERSRKDNA